VTPGGPPERVPQGAEGGWTRVVPPEFLPGKSHPVQLGGARHGGLRLESMCMSSTPPPVFRVSVPCIDQVRALRLDALLWLAEACTGERNLWTLCSALSFHQIFGVAFNGWDESLLTEMVAFCHFCEEHIPGDLEVGDRLHPAMLLHWRVQGAAVGLLCKRDRDVYQSLLSNRRVKLGSGRV
jgi:hypothetical protein